MPFKTLVFPVVTLAGVKAGLPAALALANRLGAHLDCLYVRPHPPSFTPAEIEWHPQVLAEIEQEYDTRETDLKAAFDQIVAAKGDAAAVAWVRKSGYPEAETALHARCGDLTVIARAETRQAGMASLEEDIVARSGKPLFILPKNAAAPTATALPGTVVIAWNGSLEATRAVSAAMPFLHSAERVVVLTLGKLDNGRPGPDAMTTNLSRHGIAAEAITEEDVKASVADHLLAAADALSADLLVVGAYSSARWKEAILGGTTRSLLEDAPIPVLMAH